MVHRTSLALVAALFFSCEKKSDTIVDSAGTPPFIATGSISPSVVLTDTMNVGSEQSSLDILSISVAATARVKHQSGTAAISSVQATAIAQDGSSILASMQMKDNGVAPDVTAGDSIYSARVAIQIQRSTVGQLSLEISAASGSYSSNSLLLPLTIVRLNHAPVLSNLQAPDTVRKSVTSSFLFTVKATDADGQSDIVSVTRTTPSGLVLFLNDQGLNGDATAADSIYTETVSVDAATPEGNYLFKFTARDKLNAKSNVLEKTVTIRP